MLSILLTAAVVVFALLASMRLRSPGRAAACVGAAGVAFFLLAGRPLDNLARPRTRFVYAIDAEHAVSPGPMLPARTGAAVEVRLKRTGHPASELRASGDRIEFEIPADAEGAARVRDALSVVGRLELALVVEETDLFKSRVDAPDLPPGLRFEIENAPLGPGRTVPVHYAFMPRAEGEPMAETLSRLSAWTGTLPVPETQRITFEKVSRFDPDTGTSEDEGWRTHILERAPFLTGDHIAAAQASPDLSERSLGGWLVRLELTTEGAGLFEDATARYTMRRFAIAVDGIVASAPVIQGRIAGGQAVITMGAGSPDEQAASARRLEAVLQSGALPAPLLLLSEDRIDPPLPRAGWGALVAFTAAVLVAQLLIALRLAFRRPSPLATRPSSSSVNRA